MLLTCVLCPVAHAYRPFDGGDAAVAGAGVLEIDTALNRHHRHGVHTQSLPALTFTYGPDDDTEVSFGGRFAHHAHAPQEEHHITVDDIVLSFKHLLRRGSLQDEQGASVALECGLLAPALRGEDGAGAGCSGIVSHRVAAGTGHLTLTATRNRAGQLSRYAGVVLEGPDSWRVRPALEAGIERTGGVYTRSVLAGLLWQLQNGPALGLALRHANDGASILELRFGAKWSLH